MDFFDSFKFLSEHPIFSDAFSYCLDVDVVKVDPKTDRIEDDERRNTKTQVWLECGPAVIDVHGNAHSIHDLSLDCGGDTFETAIIQLAKLVEQKYGEPGSPLYATLQAELSSRKPFKDPRPVIDSGSAFNDDDDEFPFEEHHSSEWPFDDPEDIWQ